MLGFASRFVGRRLRDEAATARRPDAPSQLFAHDALFGAYAPTIPAQPGESQLQERTSTALDGREEAIDAEVIGNNRPVGGIEYLVPTDLHRTPLPPMRILAIGSCLLDDLLNPVDAGEIEAKVDFVLAGLLSELPDKPPSDISAYDCQVFQMALRPLLPDTLLGELAAANEEVLQEAFDWSCRQMEQYLSAALKWNVDYGTTTFVMNFMQPQFSRMGRFHRRFSLANLEYYVMRLNHEIERLVGHYRNCHILDIDRIAASFGRRFVQDDLAGPTNHNARMSPHARMDGRLEYVGGISEVYEVQPDGVFREAIIAELDAMRRTILQVDSVKLVVIDLDNTLWNGLSGETEDIGPHMVEGEPLGLIEALHVLHARGILLAIISKNDEKRILGIWDKIFTGRLSLDFFVTHRINWLPKRQNMQEILEALNLLPRNVLFIDDDPAERAQMRAAYPEIRVLDGNPFLWRRILLLAPETQVVEITSESATRTQMVQAQIRRETERSTMSAEDFARQQNICVRVSRGCSPAIPRFARALELINKTNQFNTTGKRWTADECTAFFKAGGYFVFYEVEDRYTNYGLIGVVIVRGNDILQWVMSCRVIGMHVEKAVMHALSKYLRSTTQHEIHGKLVATDSNQPSRSLFENAGFSKSADGWTLEEGVEPSEVAFIQVDFDMK